MIARRNREHSFKIYFKKGVKLVLIVTKYILEATKANRKLNNGG
ncbi:hypothetical protein [Clostridium frigoris]|nr:hypothetical protein [Clostridium frigoris]